MSPEYLEDLADFADPDKLWQHGLLSRNAMSREQRRQLDTGVALRRYASHIKDLQRLMHTGKSLVITPLSSNSTAIMTIPMPEKHLQLLEAHERHRPTKVTSSTTETSPTA